MPARAVPAPSLLFGSALAFAVLVSASCAGGTRHIGEITPAVSGTVSGIWVLNEAESDDPEEAMRSARPARDGAAPQGGRRPPSGGGMPGGGRGGMAPGGGMRSGGQVSGRGGDPEAAQALGRMATVVPRRLGLTLSDSAVVLTYPREEPWILPFGQGVKREAAADVEVEAKAEWKGGLLSVTRQVSGAGSVKETFHATPDRHRLTVAVEFTMGRMGKVEFRRVYQPEGTMSGEPPR